MQRTRPQTRLTQLSDKRARSMLRWCLIAAMCAGLLSCSDSSEYSPLSNGDDVSSPAAFVTGTVRDTDTTPISDVVVTIEPTIDGIAASVAALLSSDKEQPQSAAPERRATVTDALGRFEFAGVAGGNYIVQAIADDHLGASSNITVPNVPALAETIVVDVVLTPTGSFSGTALLENGVTHESTVVYAEGTSYVGVTDPSGAYELSGVPLGTYTVRATHPGYLDDSESGTITAAGEEVVLATMTLLINSNIPPTAQILSPVAGFTNFPTSFSGIANDVDGTVVLFEWDFENDGIFDTADSTSGDTTHVYTTAGTKTAKLRVTDNQGGIGLAAITFDVDDAEPAIYMSASTGNDANTGTPLDPVATLATAYTLAAAGSLDVIIAEAGLYSEVPVFQGGVSIKGGRELPSWTLGVGYTQFAVGESRATANNISLPGTTNIFRIWIQTTNQTGPSNSIALYSSNSSSTLVFEECWFTASDAGDAAGGGSNGSSGIAGSMGGNGFPGTCDAGHGLGGNGGASAGGCPGGGGGRGGFEGSNPGLNGASGFCSGGIGGNGGAGGVSNLITCPDDDGKPGGNGLNGASGTGGAQGIAASGSGFVVGGEWVPESSSSGGPGGSGRGGGGGGGGGGQGGSCVDEGGGNGGGGGGGGGQGGGGGGGGNGGYGSFAVFLNNSSPQFLGCIFDAGDGGQGTNGGNGSDGAIGGAGGIGATVCTSEVGAGGNGGAGGTGGAGGGGAGGPGGVSYCVYRGGASSPSISGETYITGNGGSGGLGGRRGSGGPFAPNGPPGLFGGLF